MLRIRLTVIIWIFTQSYPEGTLGFVERQLRNAKNGHPENQVSQNTYMEKSKGLTS